MHGSFVLDFHLIFSTWRQPAYRGNSEHRLTIQPDAGLHFEARLRIIVLSVLVVLVCISGSRHSVILNAYRSISEREREIDCAICPSY